MSSQAQAMSPEEPATGDGDVALGLRGLEKRYGEVVAVDRIDLDVQRGEFITLLGPSGSGKTTTLRMIAGFTAPTSGTIAIAGRDMTRIPPYHRDVGMVFQNYALFPHMTAAQNIAFPLEMRRMARSEINRLVGEALELVKLERHGGRYPRQLSGGQQQRIALARAIVFRPRLLLMDEPLGALDKKLREALQLEILRIARQLEATVVYVTHDQEEALTMSDRIAIFQSGRIAQIGRGDDLYDRPASLFVADFIGESNILRGRFEAGPNGGHLRRGEWTWRLPVGAAERAGLSDGAPAALVIRPERARLFAADDDGDGDWNATSARIREVLYLGATRKYELVLEDGQAAVVRSQVSGSGDGRADGSANGSWASGDRVKVRWSIADGIVVPDTTAGEAVGSGGEREIESV